MEWKCLEGISTPATFTTRILAETIGNSAAESAIQVARATIAVFDGGTEAGAVGSDPGTWVQKSGGQFATLPNGNVNSDDIYGGPHSRHWKQRMCSSRWTRQIACVR
jgi:hypothetical protein